MAKNRNSGRDQDDSRLGHGGGSGTGDAPMGGMDPVIPLEAQDGPLDDEQTLAPDPATRATGDHAYKRWGDAGEVTVEPVVRDDSDRAFDDREHQERELSDDERLELFRMALFQNQLPTLPPIPGYHPCWLTTQNPRDSIQGRIQLGYSLIRSSELPGWEHAELQEGRYQGYIGVNEMVAAKLPLRLYEMYMTEAHHNQPLAEEGKLTATLDAIRAQAKGRAPISLEPGMEALGQRRVRPRFEEIHSRRRD